MSSEIIEAVFRYSEINNEPLMLITSMNQIDWDGGYVNNWTTKEYAKYIEKLKDKYKNSKIYICRDHCGPGFKKESMEEIYKTIDEDIACNFDLIHIDFCKFKGSYREILNESKEAIQYIKAKNKNISIEIGTDENTGSILNDVSKIEKEMEFFSSLSPIEFFVCQTGSLIKEINQVGNFNTGFIKKIKQIAKKYNLLLKEHNADYLNGKKIAYRKNLIDAVNVAPQYGAIQTLITIQKCITYGIDYTKFLQKSYDSKKWEKWMYKNDSSNKYLCSVIAGHYNFNDDSYINIYNQINQHENFRETIINQMMRNFKLYLNNL